MLNIIYLSSVLTLCACMLITLSLPGNGYAGSEYDAYFKFEHFRWQEYENGYEAVKESGPLFGGGASASWDINSLLLNVYGEVFGGQVKYDGKTTGVGTSLSIRTDSDYLGFEGGGKIGWKFPVGERSSVEPFIGPTFKYWNRIIQGKSKDGIQIADTEENWLIVYAPIGMNVRHSYRDDLSVYVGGGFNIPIYNENEAVLSDIYGVDVTVKPGKEFSYFIEAGIKWKKFKATAYYKTLEFSESDPVTEDIAVGTLTVVQPASDADMIGVTVGYSF